MIVSGIEVSPAAEASLESWMQQHKKPDGFRAAKLAAQVQAMDIPSLAVPEVAMRVADRLLQKHKRLRNVRLHGANNWCWAQAETDKDVVLRLAPDAECVDGTDGKFWIRAGGHIIAKGATASAAWKAARNL